jgi:nitronate monooxygenase
VILEQLSVPLVLAPLAGGPSTPLLAAEVSDAGGLGFLAAGYLTAEALRDRLAEARRLTSRPIAVNVFGPVRRADPREYTPFVVALGGEARRAAVELGSPRFDDDDLAAKLDLLVEDPVPVVSFTFACPPEDVISRLRAAGSEVWLTVTTPEEAREAARAGADALVVQGGEAGGHRGAFVDRKELPIYGLLALLQLVRAAVDTPLVATGGIATGQAVAAVLCTGARAAQLGTAFLRCPEAGTSEVHRRALATPGATALTRAFTGRLARGVRNRFMDEYGAQAPIAYPEIHHVTAPLRAAGRRTGDAEVVNLWAGEAHELAEDRPAAEIVRSLAEDARQALRAAQGPLGGNPA